MKLSGFRSAVCAVLLAMAGTAAAQEGPKFEFHGFIGGSLYAQDAVFDGFGQRIFFVSKTPNVDRITFGGDARQTRVNFSLAGPKVFGGAVPKGVLEMDFFGITNYASATTTTTINANGTATSATTLVPAGSADYNFIPRIRLAYAELNWGATILRIGQENDLVLGGFGPASVGHIPQTFGYGSGVLGARHQMVELIETVPAGDMKVELALQVMNPTSNAAALDSVTGQSFANSSGLPGVQGRIRLLVPKLLEAYVVGHWNQIDRNGADDATGTALPATISGNQTVAIGGGGLKLTLGPLTIQGQGWVGENVGYFSNFDAVPAVNQPDLHEFGAWGQIGFNITPAFSAWAYAGTEHTYYREATNPAKFATTPKLGNITYHGMLRYMDGGYAIGVEYIHMITHYIATPAGSTVASKNGVLEGDQLMLSGFYFF